MTTEAPTAPARDRPGDRVALLIIDLMNEFSFEGGEELRAKAQLLAPPLFALRAQVEEAGGVIVYVNDNFSEWHSEQSTIVSRARDAGIGALGELAPRETDYFIIKPQFSGFYATNLPVLLPKLGVSRLILTGLAADICVLFTAADAHMRDYALWIPADAVVSPSDTRKEAALDIMKESMGAQTAPTRQLDVSAWIRGLDDARHNVWEEGMARDRFPR